jgi:hypothetical protein
MANDIPITPGSGRLVATDQINNGGQLEDYQLIKLVDGTAGSLNKLLIDAANAAKVNIGEYGGTAVTLGQKVMASSIPVALSSDQTVIPVSQSGTWTVQPGNTANTTPWLTTINQGGNSATVTASNALKTDSSAVTQPVSGTVTSNQGTANATPWNENIAQFGGVNTSLGSKLSASSIPVVIASDQAVTVNLNQISAVSLTLGSKTSANSIPVVIASDQGNVAVSQATAANLNVRSDETGATGSAVPARANFPGALATTANPTNATAGNLVGLMADKAGRLVTTSGHVRDLTTVTSTNFATTSEVTFIAAGGAGVFNDISSITFVQLGSTATTVTLKDSTGGTTRLIVALTATTGNMQTIYFPIPMPQATANNNWTITLGTADTGGVQVSAVSIKNT